MRLLVWLGLALIVYFALRSKARSMRENLRKSAQSGFGRRGSGTGPSPGSTQPRSAVPAENMVACAHCQLDLPSSEAVRLVTATSVQSFCSEEHLRIHSGRSVTPGTDAE